VVKALMIALMATAAHAQTADPPAPPDAPPAAAAPAGPTTDAPAFEPPQSAAAGEVKVSNLRDYAMGVRVEYRLFGLAWAQIDRDLPPQQTVTHTRKRDPHWCERLKRFGVTEHAVVSNKGVDVCMRELDVCARNGLLFEVRKGACVYGEIDPTLAAASPADAPH
jgi:hypothetical protein